MSTYHLFYIRHTGERAEGVVPHTDGNSLIVTHLNVGHLLMLQQQLTEAIAAELRRLGYRKE